MAAAPDGAKSQADGRPRRRLRLTNMVGLGRLELPTSRLSSARSNQLSYKPEPDRSQPQAASARLCFEQQSPSQATKPVASNKARRKQQSPSQATKPVASNKARGLSLEERETKAAKSRIMVRDRPGA
jgi:hypothetical protein